MYLGVLVDRIGFQPSPKRIKPIFEYREMKQLQRFLGLASWYREFLLVATITEPLTYLTKKSVKYEWKEQQQRAFEQIKALLATASMPQWLSDDHELVIQNDASDTGLGSIIFQVIDRKECAIRYASRLT